MSLNGYLQLIINEMHYRRRAAHFQTEGGVIGFMFATRSLETGPVELNTRLCSTSKGKSVDAKGRELLGRERG